MFCLYQIGEDNTVKTLYIIAFLSKHPIKLEVRFCLKTKEAFFPAASPNALDPNAPISSWFMWV